MHQPHRRAKRIQTYVLYYLSNCAYKRAVCIRVCDALTSTRVCVCVFELFRNTLPPHNEHEPAQFAKHSHHDLTHTEWWDVRRGWLPEPEHIHISRL